MPVWEYTSNVQLSEFALKLRKYRIVNGLSLDGMSKEFGVGLVRMWELENDRAKPTFLEKRRIKRCLAKQKTASSK